MNDVADEIESCVRQLRTSLDAYQRFVPVGSDLAAVQRIEVARTRLVALVHQIGSGPDLFALALMAMVRDRLRLDGDLSADDGPAPRGPWSLVELDRPI